MSVSEIIAIYEKLSPEHQAHVREYVQQLVDARKGKKPNVESSPLQPAKEA